jgi:hypothetical protein
MELVPIVITSLEIVSALAIITLVVSYIGYRIKSKNRVDETIPAIDLKPNFNNSGLKRITHLTREIINVPRNLSPSPKPKTPKAVKEPPKPNKSVKEPPKQAAPVKREPVVDELNSKRLQVIKNLPVQSGIGKETTEMDDSKEKKNLSSLGDDILNKYSDEESDKLFSLKTGKGKPKN